MNRMPFTPQDANLRSVGPPSSSLPLGDYRQQPPCYHHQIPPPPPQQQNQTPSVDGQTTSLQNDRLVYLRALLSRASRRGTSAQPNALRLTALISIDLVDALAPLLVLLGL